MFTLAHISDPHGTSPRGASAAALWNKRLSGWLSWHFRRRRRHRPEVLAALLQDLKGQAPDHIAVTGDLTNLALEQEFLQARAWLEQLGAPSFVSVIPGNHDAYVAIQRRSSWALWERYLESDPDWRREAAGDGAASSLDDPGFPAVRIRGEIALVGVCTALPCGWFRATGRVGEAQLTRLRGVLSDLRERSLCRIVLLHHSPIDAGGHRRHRLIDAAAFRALLEEVGAELVLHGHRHLSSVAWLQGGRAPIPVVGVRSASDIGVREPRRAQYHLVEIDRGADAATPWRMRIRVRGYRPATVDFGAEGEHRL